MNEQTHITREGLLKLLEVARAAQEQMQDEITAKDAKLMRYDLALKRIAAVGKTGTIFQSDFEYMAQIARDALKDDE